MPAISGGKLFQNSVYVGINLEDILYGVELVLYFQTMHTLLNRKGRRRRSEIFYTIFSTVMLLIVTFWVSTQAIFGQQMWLLDTDFPGGPDAFWGANITVWYMDVATLSLVMLQLMTDALMIYRCWAVWNSYRIIIVPLILWLITLVLGVLVGWSSTASRGFYFHQAAVFLGLAYFSISVFLTATVTCMICLRIVLHARTVRKRLACEYASPYFAITALIVESVLPYSLSGIAFVMSLALGSQTMGAFAYVYTLMMCVSPQMLILRVATGTAWRKHTGVTQPQSTLMFSPQPDTFMLETAVSKSSDTQGWSRNSDSHNAVSNDETDHT